MNPHLLIFFHVLVLFHIACAQQNSGAYSSPQYAKKAYYNRKYNGQFGSSDTFYQKIGQSDNKQQENDKSKLHEIDLSEYSNRPIEPAHLKSYENYTSAETNDIASYNNGVNETQSGRSAGGFMQSAGEFLNGRGGQMLADIARELIARSTGASSQVGDGGGCFSQVLSLNLTNLVILVILKALILAAGMFGAGAWTHGYARSLDDNSNSQLISGPELDLWMSYLQGRPECLQLSACKNPKLAKKYSGGADLILTVAKFTNGVVPYDIQYEKILDHVKEATTWATAGMPCEDRYKCTPTK